MDSPLKEGIARAGGFARFTRVLFACWSENMLGLTICFI